MNNQQPERIEIVIQCGNAAFGDGEQWRNEVARILRSAAIDLQHDGKGPGEAANLRDVNGNLVGKVVIR